SCLLRLSFWLADAICRASEAMATSKLRNGQSLLLPISMSAAPLKLNGKTDRQLFGSRQTQICCLTLRTMFRTTHCICARGTTFGLPMELKLSSQVQRGPAEGSGAPSS